VHDAVLEQQGAAGRGDLGAERDEVGGAAGEVVAVEDEGEQAADAVWERDDGGVVNVVDGGWRE